MRRFPAVHETGAVAPDSGQLRRILGGLRPFLPGLRRWVETGEHVVDELAAAAELVMGKASGIPAAVVRGVDRTWFDRGSVREEIVRPPAEDLFR